MVSNVEGWSINCMSFVFRRIIIVCPTTGVRVVHEGCSRGLFAWLVNVYAQCSHKSASDHTVSELVGGSAAKSATIKFRSRGVGRLYVVWSLFHLARTLNPSSPPHS